MIPIRPKLDQKYFTSLTYWTKWNYLTKWDSNTMGELNVIVDNIVKNPQVVDTSYTKNQFDHNAQETTIVLDMSKVTVDKYLFGNESKAMVVNLILLNYTGQVINNAIYLAHKMKVLNISAYDVSGHPVDRIYVQGYFATEAASLETINAPILVIVSGQIYDATFYNAPSLSKMPDVDLSQCREFNRLYKLSSLARLPFKNVACPMLWGTNPGNTTGSLMPKVDESEWARWFTEDLKTVNNLTLVLGDNLPLLSDATKKIATDKGWILA